jgi:hypothetical protein
MSYFLKIILHLTDITGRLPLLPSLGYHHAAGEVHIQVCLVVLEAVFVF